MGDNNKKPVLHIYINAVALAVLLIGGARILSSYAITSFPPGSLLQPNDVTSSHIRDFNITNVDISSSAAIAWQKVASSGVIVDANVSSTANINLSKTTGTLPVANGGRGTTTAACAGCLLSGNGSVFGAVTAGTNGQALIASSTAQFGVSYATFPNTPTGTVVVSEPLSAHDATSTFSLSVNTTQVLGLFRNPFQISVENLTFNVESVSAAGTADVCIYDAAGSGKIIETTTPTISAAGIVTATTSATILPPGNYYFTMIPNGTTNVAVTAFETVGKWSRPLVGPSGEPDLMGTLAGQTAGTCTTTFNPAALTDDQRGAIMHRLDGS